MAIQPTSAIVASEVVGIAKGIETLGGKQFAIIQLKSKEFVHLDANIFPGGMEWFRSKIGKQVHVRLIGRELINSKG